jgi:hypothetical protein
MAICPWSPVGLPEIWSWLRQESRSLRRTIVGSGETAEPSTAVDPGVRGRLLIDAGALGGGVPVRATG